jgi:hypothetical protein
MTKAGADLPEAVIVGVPLAVGIVAWTLHRRQVRTLPAEPALTPPPTLVRSS